MPVNLRGLCGKPDYTVRHKKTSVLLELPVPSIKFNE
jgi:hypothetical protein